MFLARIPIKLPAFIVLGAWILYQVWMFIFNSADQVSWAAHIGGIVAGVVLVVLLKRRAVPLFDREIVAPDAVEVTTEPIEKTASDVKWGR